MAKIRNGFVSNSSSSSFVITNINHPAVYMLNKIAKFEESSCSFAIDVENKTMEDLDDNAIWSICNQYDIECDEFSYQIAFNG